jgi:hypothetical protein
MQADAPYSDPVLHWERRFVWRSASTAGKWKGCIMSAEVVANQQGPNRRLCHLPADAVCFIWLGKEFIGMSCRPWLESRPLGSCSKPSEKSARAQICHSGEPANPPSLSVLSKPGITPPRTSVNLSDVDDDCVLYDQGRPVSCRTQSTAPICYACRRYNDGGPGGGFWWVPVISPTYVRGNRPGHSRDSTKARCKTK